MAPLIYTLCMLTSIMCAFLLFRTYRKRHITLLLWCGLFFAIQALSDVVLIVDKLIVPETDLSLYRYGIALIAVGFLLYGLIMRTEVA